MWWRCLRAKTKVMYKEGITERERARLMTDDELKAVVGVSACGSEDSVSAYFESLPSERKELVYAILELYERDRLRHEELPKLDCLFDVLDYIKMFAVNNCREEMHLIGIDSENKPVVRLKMASGGKAVCSVDITLMLKHLILNDCEGCIIAHNHTGKSLTPSKADDEFTEEFRQACESCKITLHDHVIVSRYSQAHYSYKRNGKL